MEQSIGGRFEQTRAIGRAHVPGACMSSSEGFRPPPMLRTMPGQVRTFGPVRLAEGTVLRLFPGDYLYETEWSAGRRNALMLIVTWVDDDTDVIAGERYVRIEGLEIREGHPTPRSVAVRVAVLDRVLRSPRNHHRGH